MGKLCDSKLCNFGLPAERRVSLIMKQGMKQRGFFKRVATVYLKVSTYFSKFSLNFEVFNFNCFGDSRRTHNFKLTV